MAAQDQAISTIYF